MIPAFTMLFTLLKLRTESSIECYQSIVYYAGMTFVVSLGRSVLLLLAILILNGCLPSPQSQSDEEKEAHFQTGKSRANAMDYPGAIESFEKALEVNPQSAAAHLELGCLYDQKEPDPARAVYHYEEYLKLQPNAGNAEIVKTRVLACKQELARTVSLGPVTQTMQHEFEQLTEENKRLREEVEKWRALYAAHPSQTNSTPAASAGRPAPPSVPPQTAQAATSSPSPSLQEHPGTSLPGSARTHSVKAGETASLIARMYGVRVDALLAANPRVDPRRLRVGQSLNIPSL
jgi:tetratricopeptide (TPR) repeat protein